MKKNAKKIILGSLLAGGLVLASFYGTGLQREQELKADAAISNAVRGGVPDWRGTGRKRQVRQAVCYVGRKLYCRYILYAGPL